MPINQEAADRSATSLPVGEDALDDRDLHVLKLCLDLQLDALLLTV